MDMRSFPALSVVQRDWTFVPTRARLRIRAFRLRNRLLRRVAAPAQLTLRAPADTGRWSIYFIFAPDGMLAEPHRFTLRRLRALGRAIMVVCATPDPARMPPELAEGCDALVWKALPGFDFSAYAAGLHVLAEHCPGSNAFVMNDSLFGPLVDLRPWLAGARWDLTGFTATANVENHIQSYAFHLRDVTPGRLAALSDILSVAHAYDDFWPVVLNQETRLARVAARAMSVGSFCYVSSRTAEDPMLQLALPMVAAGFPFLKRSLLGKLAHLHPAEDVRAALAAAGYPG